jgi:hypothetical protein
VIAADSPGPGSSAVCAACSCGGQGGGTFDDDDDGDDDEDEDDEDDGGGARATTAVTAAVAADDDVGSDDRYDDRYFFCIDDDEIVATDDVVDAALEAVSSRSPRCRWLSCTRWPTKRWRAFVGLERRAECAERWAHDRRACSTATRLACSSSAMTAEVSATQGSAGAGGHRF